MSRPSNSSSPKLISPREMEKLIKKYIPDQCSIHEIGSISNPSEAEIQKNLFLIQFNKFINSDEKKRTILLFDNLLNTWSTLYLEKTTKGVSAKHILSIKDNTELHYLDENTQKPHADDFLNFALKQATITTQVIKDTRQDHCSQQESGHLALFNSFLISQDEPVNQNSFNNQDTDDYVFQDFIANLEIKRIGLQKLLQIQKEKIKSQINKESPQKSLREKLLEERFTEQNYKKNKKFIHALFGNPELINRRHFVDCFRNNSSLEIKRIGLQKLLQTQKEKIKSQINKESPQKSLREKLLEERFTEQNYQKNKEFVNALIRDPELINRRHFVDCFRNNSSLPAYAVDKSSKQSNSR